MSVGHYENFPVASILLPQRLRWPVSVIYRFARTADDFADEGDAPRAARLAALDGYRAALDRIAAGAPPGAPLFADLAQVIRAHGLPIGLFRDLLDAFSQDVVKQRYATFAEVLDYCRRSANPVGRLLLHLFDAAHAPNLERSDAICSALQLINFWQDLAIDWRKGRVYLPREDLDRFGVSEAQLAAGDTSGGFAALMRFELARSRAMLESGAPLAVSLRGRVGLELRMIVQGGLRILDKLAAVNGDVFARRPVLGALDWPLMALRAAAMPGAGNPS
ncbi:MAG: squalene synthase HpnC [Burkholderiales bacterium]|jgi:squalene synthase HpnC|nr:squalene synthase HpnC [Burkholderiales bacterium]